MFLFFNDIPRSKQLSETHESFYSSSINTRVNTKYAQASFI